MRVVFPGVLELNTTNVAANSEAEWVSTTTYNLGDTVQVTTSTPHTVYESLRGNNTNRTPSESLLPIQEVGTSSTSNTVVEGALSFTTQTGLSFSAGMVVDITKTTTPKTVKMSAEVTGYDSGTGVLDVTVYSITGSGTHTDWTITSEDEIGFWKEVESTNQYAMFDKYVNTQTENLDNIDIKLNTERVDFVALFGLEGVLVELFMWDATETTLLWSEEIDLIYGTSVIASISDWYEYFFGEYSAREDIAEDIAVNTYSGVLRIKVSADSGAVAKCGNVVIGRSFDVGATQFSASAGFIDFSQKETDDQGRISLVQGAWAKQNSVKLYIENYRLDMVYKTLAGLRGIPTAWLANNSGTDYEMLIVYGVFKDFDITIAGPSHSWCTIEIEGII